MKKSKIVNEPEMYGICGGPSSWEVTIHRRRQRYYAHFRFEIYGSEALALAAAQAWRDETVRQHPPPTRRERAEKPRSSNKTGIPGVTCWFNDKGFAILWRAKTHIGERILSKAFSVSKWGSRAKAMAVAERERQLEELSGLASVHPAEPAIRQLDLTLTPSISPSPKLQFVRGNVIRKTNRTGISGVSRKKGHGQHPGYWTAQSFVDGQYTSKSFSVLIHGEDNARKLAIEERAKQVGVLPPTPI